MPGSDENDSEETSNTDENAQSTSNGAIIPPQNNSTGNNTAGSLTQQSEINMTSTGLVEPPGKFDFADPKKWPAYRQRFETFVCFSQEFREFASDYGFKIVTSSPRYPKSNGQAEAAVKIVKNILKKEKDPSRGLLAYRATPIAGLEASPAQLLMGRQLRTTVPTIGKNLVPKLIPFKQFAGAERRRKERTKANHDRHHGARKLQKLGPGDQVWITDLKRKGTIRCQTPQPRSYEVQSQQGVVRRNRVHLIPLTKPQSTTSPYHTQYALKQNTPPRHNTPKAATPQQQPSPNQNPQQPQNNIPQDTATTTRFGRKILKPKKLEEYYL